MIDDCRAWREDRIRKIAVLVDTSGKRKLQRFIEERCLRLQICAEHRNVGVSIVRPVDRTIGKRTNSEIITTVGQLFIRGRLIAVLELQRVGGGMILDRRASRQKE